MAGAVTVTKICTSCNQDLPEEKFKFRGATGRQSHTRHAMCNKCLYIRYTRPNAAKKTDIIQKYKLKKGCLDCGYNAHSEALEFDHKPGTEKLFNVGEKIGALSIDKVWDEIAKCEVVCANCHAIRTATRRELVTIG